MNGVQPVEARALVFRPDTRWQVVEVRHTERGRLCYRCAARRVWTVTDEGQVLEEWLFIRQEEDGTYSFSLCNASEETPLAQLAL